MLAQVAEGWIRYDPEDGPVFITQGKWQRTYLTWKRAQARAKKRFLAA